MRRPKDAAAPANTSAGRRELLGRIASGKSSIRIDLSLFEVSPALANEPIAAQQAAKGEAVRKQYMAYLDALAQTPAGFKLLSHLDQSPHKTTIEFNYKLLDNQTRSQGDGHANGKGAAPTVVLNPTRTTFSDGRRHEPWMTEREKYGFYHELVHAWHVTRGTQAVGSSDGERNSEWQAVGLRSYAKEEISENVIRRQMGKDARPEYGVTKR